jgi:Zn-dependent protease with chaperone function
MDFFARQDQARRSTKVLVTYFVLGIGAINLLLYLLVSLAINQGADSAFANAVAREDRPGQPQLRRPAERLFRGDVLVWVSLATWAIIGAGSLWRLGQLQAGGSAIASQLRGQLVRPETTDLDERKLLNVVEEMAIASGIPVPQVYVLPEDSINAFAAGYRAGDAVVGVTRGCIQLLSREELQAVVAHEFSHILNGDMRLNLRLIAWIFGIMGLALTGRLLLHVRGGRNNFLPLIGLAMILIGWIGVLFGRLIQSAVSREREFLADASAVQFTRNPLGLANALKKIGRLGAGSTIAAPQAGEVAHLFFANGLKASFLTPFATHPPLEQRIRALDPAWDGRFPAVRIGMPASPPPIPAGTADRRPPVVGSLPGMFLAGDGGAVFPPAPGPTPITLHYAAGWRAALPPEIALAAQEPLGAEATIFALVLSRESAVRQRQLAAITATAGQPSAAETERLLPAVAELATRARLPLVDLALPALRELSAPQYGRFATALQQLITADQQIDLFEYALQKVVRHHLAPQFTGTRRRAAQYYALKPLLPDCAAVLKLFAHLGAADLTDATKAWQAAWAPLGIAAPPLPSAAADDLVAFDAALDRLEQAAPPLQQKLLHAAALAVTSDGRIQAREAELLRALAETLDCPLPPFVSPPDG